MDEICVQGTPIREPEIDNFVDAPAVGIEPYHIIPCDALGAEGAIYDDAFLSNFYPKAPPSFSEPHGKENKYATGQRR